VFPRDELGAAVQARIKMEQRIGPTRCTIVGIAGEIKVLR
jgi:hypothetical protein